MSALRPKKVLSGDDARRVREERPREQVERDAHRREALEAVGRRAADLEHVPERREVDRDDDPEEQPRRGAVERVALGEVDRHGAAEDHRAHEHPRGREPQEAHALLGVGAAHEGGRVGDGGHRARRRRYSALTLPAMLKIGRYIAMIIVPTDPPMKTIMMGSSSEVMAATATSTSSS